MSTPKYVYEDEDGAVFTVYPYPHAYAGDIAAVRTGGTVYVLPEHFPDVAAGLWTGAGLPAPVILERPPVDPDGEVTVASFVMRLDNRCIGVGDARMTVDVARYLASVIAAYADAAENEPDPAEVEELTLVLRGVVPGTASPGGDYKAAVARGFAEVALRWVRDKQRREAPQP